MLGFEDLKVSYWISTLNDDDIVPVRTTDEKSQRFGYVRKKFFTKWLANNSSFRPYIDEELSPARDAESVHGADAKVSAESQSETKSQSDGTNDRTGSTDKSKIVAKRKTQRRTESHGSPKTVKRRKPNRNIRIGDKFLEYESSDDDDDGARLHTVTKIESGTELIYADGN